jgi:GNAT superfamily N-acetyltransferase
MARDDVTVTRDDVALKPAGHRQADVERVETGSGWDGALRLTVHSGGRVSFTCTATRRPTGLWFVTDCLPLRRGPAGPTLLLQACEHLFREQDAGDLIVVHPEFWESGLQAAGATPLQRMVAMRLDLDRELLAMHERPLPGRYRVTRFDPDTDDLAALIGSDGDRQTWTDVVAGDYGPPVPEATLAITADGAVRSAVAVTEFEGTPFVAQCATVAEDRGNGLGRRLLLASMSALADAGYADCRLNVEAENWIARRMYRSVGFGPAGPVCRVSHLPRGAR